MDSGEYSSDALSHHTDAGEKQPRIYLDHNATTPLAPEVHEVMVEVLKDHFGNPSGIYRESKEAQQSSKGAQECCATAQLYCEKDHIHERRL